MIDILAIMAHPDDAELLCAGALIAAVRRGGTAAVLDLTGGERGSWGTRSSRAREAEAAAAITGLTERRNAGLPDGALANDPASRAIVAAHVRALRPRTVVLHWPRARHPDHRAAAGLGRDACFLAGVRNADIEGEPFRPVKVLHALTYVEHPPKPTFVLDISDVMDRKLDAIFAFGTQFEGRTSMGDVFSGDRPLREQIRTYHAYYGSLIRCAWGEPYWTRETMAVRDASELAVSSF